MTAYTLETLENAFKEHSEKAKEAHLKQCHGHEEQYNEPYPHELFDLSLALHVICKEIKELKDKTSGISKISDNHLKFSGIKIEAK